MNEHRPNGLAQDLDILLETELLEWMAEIRYQKQIQRNDELQDIRTAVVLDSSDKHALLIEMSLETHSADNSLSNIF